MVKLNFSIGWKKSKSARKQRKYRYVAPLHTKQKFMSAHLSKELRQKHGKRSLNVRKGDKVKILVGQFKGKSGKVESANLKKGKIYIEGVDFAKKDGSKAKYPIDPSNIVLIEISLDDKMRNKILERK